MRFLLATTLAALACPGIAVSQVFPPYPPATPYEAHVEFSNDMTGVFRYQEGKLRVDASSGAGPSTAYIDLGKRTAIVVVSMQGMNMALDVDLTEFHIPEVSSTSSQLIGSDTVAGEPCQIWRVTDPASGKTGVACITQDGIPLRAGATGDKAPAMVVRQVTRGAQNAADLTPPQGMVTIKASGLGNLPIPGLGQ